MNKLDYLNKVKALLKGIVAQRKFLLVKNAGHLESNFAKQEIANIDYALPSLVDAHRAKAYLERKEAALRFLIPTSNPKRHNELRELIETQLN